MNFAIFSIPRTYMAQTSPAKPSVSWRKKKRSSTANTAPVAWFRKHGIIWS